MAGQASGVRYGAEYRLVEPQPVALAGTAVALP
jgi:hypothetical protein